MAKKEHVYSQKLEKFHKQGGCLVRHQKRTEGHPCSHQWQAQKKAESEPHRQLYNYPKYKSLCVTKTKTHFDTAVTMTDKGAFPKGYARLIDGVFKKKRPTHEGKEWDVPKKRNFKHFIKPYWNNAHHIIPNAVLSASISEAAKMSSEKKLAIIIRTCLMKAKYNLNNEINMIILPMERIVAAAIKLPRHLLRDEGQDDEKRFFSHQDYSLAVKTQLDEIMREYAAAVNTKNCDDERDQQNKEAIENLSKRIYEAIKAQGQTAGFAGEALDNMSLSVLSL